MFRFFCLSFWFATTIAGMLNAQEGETKLSILQTWQPTVDACNASIAENVSLDELLRTPDTFQGKCVRTEGFYLARALFSRERDLQRKYPSQNDASAKRRLGVYFGPDQLDKLERAEGKRINLVGLISHCDSLWGENTIMVMGYCHHTGGPIIGLALE